MKIFKTIFAVNIVMLTVCFLFNTSVKADLSWNEKTTITILADGKEMKISEADQSYALKSNLTRIDSAQHNFGKIINGFNRHTLMLNFQARSFVLFDFNELLKIDRDQNNAMMKDLANREAQIMSVPEDKRPLQMSQIEAQKRKFQIWSDQANYTVIETNEEKEINGQLCKKFVGSSGQEEFQEIWVSKNITIDHEYERYFARILSQLQPQDYGHLRFVRGLPVKVITRYGDVTVTMDVTNISESKIPKDAFIIPDDFKEAEKIASSR
jgi:Domain of unknown function (DUF4412)